MTEIDKNEVVTQTQYVNKSNSLITSFYKTNVFGNKLMTLGIAKVNDNGEAFITPSELQYIFGKKNPNIYRDIRGVTRELASSVITIETADETGKSAKKSFIHFAIAPEIEYSEGVVRISFGKKMLPHITNLSRDFTQLELATLISFKRNSSIKLYELLKKDAYKLKKFNKKYVSVRYELNELRSILGLLATKDYIIKAIEKGTPWMELDRILKPEDVQFARTTDLIRRVIEPAQKEMNEHSDITFEYELEKGAHGKVIAFEFLISRNKIQEENRTIIKNRVEKLKEFAPSYNNMEDDVIDIDEISEDDAQLLRDYAALKDYLKDAGLTTRSISKLTIEYFEKLYAVANRDIKRIYRQVDYGTKQTRIRDYYKWLYAAVQNNYESDAEPVTVEFGSEENAEASDHMQEMYDSIADDTKRTVWNRFKQKEKFPGFLAHLGMDVETLEEAFSVEECIDAYMNYIRGI